MGLQEDSNIMGVLSAWPGLSAHPCNSCRSASAALFCRSHSAYLCLTCDANIHDMRSCAPRHERVWVCEVCEQAPASVTCKADAAALCASCDRDIHSANPLARRHERVPVVPFCDSAAECVARSAASTATFLTPDKGVSDAGFKDEGGSDGWLIPNPSLDMDAFLGLDCELPNLQKIELEEMRSCHFGVTDSVVPTQSGGNSSFLFGNHDSCFDIDFTRSKLSPFNYANHSISTSLTSSDIGVVPDGNLNSNSNSISEVTFTFTKPTRQITNTDASTTANGIPMSTTKVSDMDRTARVLRYREKRKNRKFEKTIRYTSRKAYAEMRPRIKGRFAKRTDVNNRGDPLLGSESGSGSDIFSLDYGGYGVVPSS